MFYLRERSKSNLKFYKEEFAFNTLKELDHYLIERYGINFLGFYIDIDSDSYPKHISFLFYKNFTDFKDKLNPAFKVEERE